MYNEVYRFSRRRKNYLFGLSGHYKSKKKSDCMINADRSKMLDSGFFENQVWGALHKAWKGYVITKNKYHRSIYVTMIM
ncbi:MAG: hypothetical protein ACJ71M_04060 [Nitrososphaeraceae archaeon]